jgi:phosphoribosyl 1,2-cyclic phosphodiesterase
MHATPNVELSSTLKFWGVRGSIPSPGPSTLRYGGNTSCVEIRLGGKHFIIDCGSGIRGLGGALLREFGKTSLDLTILISHTHWDHIQGFPFFAPAFIPGNKIAFYGRPGLKEALEGQMDGGQYFPIKLSMMGSKPTFNTYEDTGFKVGDVTITTSTTSHPGGCTAYRLEYAGKSVVYLSDHETGGDHDINIYQFIKDADVVVADSQYDATEMASRKGWGHGCVDTVVSMAVKANVKRLYLFHHDPMHDDTFMDNFVLRAKADVVELKSTLEVDAAREGAVVSL